MSQNHLTREILLLYIDGGLPHGDRIHIESHLRECHLCADVAAGMMRVGNTLRSIPPEQTSAGFTASVLHDLGLVSSRRRRLLALESAGALVAMVVVAGVLISVFVATGVLQEKKIADTQSAAGMLLGKAGGAIAESASAVSGLVASYFPFAFGKGVFEISIVAVAILGLLAVADWFVGRRLVHRPE